MADFFRKEPSIDKHSRTGLGNLLVPRADASRPWGGLVPDPSLYNLKVEVGAAEVRRYAPTLILWHGIRSAEGVTTRSGLREVDIEGFSYGLAIAASAFPDSWSAFYPPDN